IEDSEAHSAATGSRPCSWSSVSWRRMTAVSTPRRRWLGATLTQVTPAQGTTPPGTVSSRLWTPDVATTRSPSHSPSERSSSACAGTASTKDAGGSAANAVKKARLNDGQSSGVAGRSWSARSVTRAVYPVPSRASPAPCRVPRERASRGGQGVLLRGVRRTGPLSADHRGTGRQGPGRHLGAAGVPHDDVHRGHLVRPTAQHDDPTVGDAEGGQRGVHGLRGR